MDIPMDLPMISSEELYYLINNGTLKINTTDSVL